MDALNRLAPFFLLLLPLITNGQVINTAMMDTVENTVIGHVGLGGYVDSYYSYNFNKPSDDVNPYFVSSARNNELTVNLAYVDVRYRSTNMRARFVPGFGTYMDANYKNEPGSLKNMVEANVGIRIPNSKIWVDIGVLGSPYTNESAISKDHLMYLRSFAPENVPYWVTGARATIPVSPRVNAYLYVINGWQVIQDNNKSKSIATQLEVRPNRNLLLNWNTYIGNEESKDRPELRMRYFNDFYVIYRPEGKKISATSDFYFGYQEKSNASTAFWWQANVIGKYTFTNIFSLSGRLEHFDDPNAAVIPTNINGGTGFRASSVGLCANFNLYKLTLFRFEGRQFFSQDNVYKDPNGVPTNISFMLVASLTAWF